MRKLCIYSTHLLAFQNTFLYKVHVYLSLHRKVNGDSAVRITTEHLPVHQAHPGNTVRGLRELQILSVFGVHSGHRDLQHIHI